MAVPSHWLGVGRERTTEDDKLPGSDHPQCPYQYNLGRLGYDCEWLMDYEYDYGAPAPASWHASSCLDLSCHWTPVCRDERVRPILCKSPSLKSKSCASQGTKLLCVKSCGDGRAAKQQVWKPLGAVAADLHTGGSDTGRTSLTEAAVEFRQLAE